MTSNCHVLLCMLTAKTWNTQQSPILAQLQPIAQQGIDKSARIRQMPQALQGDRVPALCYPLELNSGVSQIHTDSI